MLGKERGFLPNIPEELSSAVEPNDLNMLFVGTLEKRLSELLGFKNIVSESVVLENRFWELIGSDTKISRSLGLENKVSELPGLAPNLVGTGSTPTNLLDSEVFVVVAKM